MYRQSEKNLLSSNISSTCPHNMVNLGPLAAEIVSLVWSTPGNFNGFRVLAALLHGTLVVGVSQTAALNRGRHRYSAGRPSRWALTHISSCVRFSFFSTTSRDWMRRTSPKLPVLRRVRHTQSINLLAVTGKVQNAVLHTGASEACSSPSPRP